ncbi:MAG: phage tail sheath subtilisin-like domain-containing protein [Fimbriimonas sp.]|nr:phage tail sheath subtilisin-like domain-containing protein [Fimbriimonas sp.]
MPISPTYPGVYIQEIPSGVRTIVGVATSVTAFVGRALRGPVNEPTTINSFGDFERLFGGLWSESTMSYAIRDFFLNGGAQAVVVRLYKPDFADDATRVLAYNAARLRAVAASTAVSTAATGPVGATAIKAAATTATNAQIAGAPGDVAVSVAATYILNIIRDTADGPRPKSEVGTDTTAAALALTSAADNAIAAITTMCGDMTAATPAAAKLPAGQADATAAASPIKEILQAIIDSFGGSAPTNAAIAAVQATEVGKQNTIKTAVNAVRDAVTTEVGRAGSTLSSIATVANSNRDSQISISPLVSPAVTSLALSVNAATLAPPNDSTIVAAAVAGLSAAADAGANAFAPRSKAVLPISTLTLTAAYEGAWGNNLQARITTDTEGVRTGSDPKAFNLYVKDGNTGAVEAFLEISADSSQPRYVNAVLENESVLVTNESSPTVVACSEPSASLGVVAERDAWNSTNSTSVTPNNYGSDGSPLENAAFIESRTDKKGIYALERIDLFNLLCLPPLTFDVDIDGSIIDDAISYCTERRAFMIIDPISSWANKDQAKAGMANPGFSKSDSSAMFFPKLQAKDPLRGNRVMNFAPCGVVAGIMARTDTNRGIWKAPAGLDAGIVGYPGVAVDLTDAENGELNPLGLNCIRSNAAGRIIWGSRTMRGDNRFASEYKYIPVRRLALHIENSLYQGLQWVVFEPNDEPLWAQIRLNVGAFMQGLFSQGAFEGKTPSDAYFVKCDGETTTATDRNLGVVNIIVGFAPLKPAEFVIISLQQIAQQDA